MIIHKVIVDHLPASCTACDFGCVDSNGPEEIYHFCGITGAQMSSLPDDRRADHCTLKEKRGGQKRRRGGKT